ncbi:hypothetical protein CGLO_09434 [Colletotrichum gloeosporioides Cg-14]|uniref:Uncharacterized protein n=1 Tax=Colletotrichum gloeosporioides (strain Cg-14) TaxID=1237896 RepID=T0LS54_COLGC|nr:hypothetical protein CGLO_09434 [Colletotrichum gloeosporioides Cg-14]
MAVTACAGFASAGIHPYRKNGAPATPGVPAPGSAWIDKDAQEIEDNTWAIEAGKSKLASRRHARDVRA